MGWRSKAFKSARTSSLRLRWVPTMALLLFVMATSWMGPRRKISIVGASSQPKQSSMTAGTKSDSAASLEGRRDVNSSSSWWSSWMTTRAAAQILQSAKQKDTVPRADVALVERAQRFVRDRQRVYEDLGIGVNWHLRGVAFAYRHLRLLVAGQIELWTSSSAVPTRGRVVFFNVHPSAQPKNDNGANTTTLRDDCHFLNLWVRLNGPEVYAGRAVAVSANATLEQPCYWTYEFELSVPGNYTLDSKLLLWNGDAHGDGRDVCRIRPGPVSNDTLQAFPIHYGLRGFKLYHPDADCCEICARQRDPPCRYFASPAFKIRSPHRHNNGCELFFAQEDIARAGDLPFQSAILGDLVNYSFPGFNVARGLKNWDPPVWNQRRRLASDSATTGLIQPLVEDTYVWNDRRGDVAFGRDQNRRRRLRRMGPIHGSPYNRSTTHYLGCGWHPFYTLEVPCVSGALDDKVILSQDWLVVEAPAVQDTVAVEASEPPPLPACTQEHELMDNVRGRWVKLPWPNETECPLPSFDLERPRCWHRDDLSGIGYGCGESNCRSIWPGSRWESSLREKKFNAAWRNHDCDYFEFTNAQLNECLATKKIAKFKFAGASIAKQLEDTMKRLLPQLKLYNVSEPDAITVTFGTFGILHWSIQPTAANRKQLQAVKHVDPTKEIKIIVNGYYLNSERQTHCHADYIRRMNYLLEKILIPRNLTVVDAYHVSQALVYDVASQFDGMHLKGPMLKVSIIKLWHYLCADVVKGSRV